MCHKKSHFLILFSLAGQNASDDHHFLVLMLNKSLREDTRVLQVASSSALGSNSALRWSLPLVPLAPSIQRGTYLGTYNT